MNNDLISREALKKKFDEYIKANPNISGIFELGKIIIDTAPTVEPERPAGDLISREDLKKAIEKEICNFELPISANEIMPIIDNAPTVDMNTKLSVAYLKGRMQGQLEQRPQGKWIPVSERLPNRNGCYNVTRIIEGTAISDVCYFDGQNTWHRDTGVNHGRPYLTDIIAWQPLPEPYKKGEEE